MDKHQLTTIAVTALISVIARESIGWFVSLAKAKAATDKTKATARKVFSKNNLLIAWELALSILGCFLLARIIRLPAPVTRLAVFFIAALTVMVILQILIAVFHIGYFMAICEVYNLVS